MKLRPLWPIATLALALVCGEGRGADIGAGPDPNADEAAAAALAAQILAEVEADAGDTGPAASAPTKPAKARPGATAPRGGQGQGTGAQRSDEEREWREFGKTALEWVKDRMPWRGDDGRAEAASTAPPAPVEWVEAGLGGAAGPFGAAGPGTAKIMPGGVTYQPPQAPGGSSPVLEPGTNPIQEALDAIREIVGHPMTWLVLTLIAVGAFAVKRLDRRPK